MNNLLFSTSAVIALLAAVPASATDAGPKISYVPRSMAQSVISHGPWTLHESADRFDHDESGDHFRHEGSDERPEHEDHNDFFKHDASGIVPTTAGPPSLGSGGPYAGPLMPTRSPPVNHGPSVM